MASAKIYNDTIVVPYLTRFGFVVEENGIVRLLFSFVSVGCRCGLEQQVGTEQCTNDVIIMTGTNFTVLQTCHHLTRSSRQTAWPNRFDLHIRVKVTHLFEDRFVQWIEWTWSSHCFAVAVAGAIPVQIYSSVQWLA